MRPAARILLALLLALGLVAPKLSAAAGLLASNGATMVICTGAGLAVVTLDAEGRPVKVAVQEEPCGLLAPPPGPASSPAAWSPASLAAAPLAAAPLPPLRAAAGLPPPSRAPPPA
jgi:hypothetical protein